jgi:PleD family two-component response regulator
LIGPRNKDRISFIKDVINNQFALPKRALYRALVANDDFFQLSIISSIMRNCGFDVTEAENG